jgi:hypothetical protein
MSYSSNPMLSQGDRNARGDACAPASATTEVFDLVGFSLAGGLAALSNRLLLMICCERVLC